MRWSLQTLLNPEKHALAYLGEKFAPFGFVICCAGEKAGALKRLAGELGCARLVRGVRTRCERGHDVINGADTTTET